MIACAIFALGVLYVTQFDVPDNIPTWIFYVSLLLGFTALSILCGVGVIHSV